MNPRPTLAVGYDAVLAVDPDVYTVSEDAAGRAYAFDMADAREALGEVIQSVLEYPNAVEAVEIEPGYIRVRIASSDPLSPKALLESLESIPDTYNSRYATAPDLDGLAFDRRYITTYRPEDAPEQEPFVDTHGPGEDAPEHDGAVFTYEHDDADEADFLDNRRFRYRIVLPFDAEMYESEGLMGRYGTPPVRWDDDAVLEALLATAEDVPAWPGLPENMPRIAVFPEYAVLEYVTGSITVGPKRLVSRTMAAFSGYNQRRNIDEENSTKDKKQRHPPIKFTPSVYVAGADADRTAEAWIGEHDLDTVDGEPITPTPDPEPEPDADEADPDGGFWSAVVGR